MHRGPGEKLRPRPALWRQYTSGCHGIERVAQQLIRVKALVRRAAGIGRHFHIKGTSGKRGTEPACLRFCKAQIAPAYSCQQASCTHNRVRHLLGNLHLLLYRLGQRPQGSGAHRFKQGLVVGKVTVSRVGRHARQPADFTQDNRLGASFARQRQPHRHHRLA
ncbi:hypothetical protein D3C71_1606480 [compost metagenome]